MKTLLVDDHALFRAGLRLLLGTIDRDADVTEVASVAQALSYVAGHPDLDLCLLDLALKNESGLNAISQLKEIAPGVAIVVVSAAEDSATILACLEAGAMSFISKSSAPEVLTHALRRVLAGDIYLPDQISESPDAVSMPKLPFSPRQLEVMSALSRGLPNKLIARELGLSEYTVREYISAIYRSLGVHSRTQAVIKVAQLGIPMNAERARQGE